MKYSALDGHAIMRSGDEFDAAIEDIASEMADKLIDIPLTVLVYYEHLYRRLYGKRDSK